MPELVFNTGPIIALTAAVGSLQFLDKLYTDLLIPSEVIDELKAAGDDCAELNAMRTCRALRITETPVRLPILLASQLDKGEASVIQNALNFKVSTVVIDEKAGRRMARLHHLKVTGSLGILIRAAKLSLTPSIESCLNRMQSKGIWISEELKVHAIAATKS